MKKTLIALAVLSAAGASFAQVTITGKLGFGSQRLPINASVAFPTADSQNGMIMTDGNVTFAATEDLGGGMKVTASSELRLRGREDNPSVGLARNATIAMTTGFGVVGMGSIEAPTALLGGFAGAPVDLAINADGNATTTAGIQGQTALSGRANIDFVNLTMPVGPVIVTAWYSEVNSIGTGQAGNSTGITAGTVSARYTAGPLTVFGDYTNFQTKSSAAAKPSFDGRDRYRVWGTYDFGMAKVGVGYQTINKSQPDEANAGLTVPMGAVTFGLTYAQREAQKADATIGQAAAPARTFTGVGVQYDFSKMTNVNLSYGTNTGPTQLSDEYRIKLIKNF